jgi:hypothetical protein
MAQMMTSVVWAVFFVFVHWRQIWGRWGACVDGGGGRMRWDWSHGSRLLLWELSGKWCHFVFFFFHEHMTTWSVHGRRVYKYPPNDHFSIGVCPTAHNCNIVVL